MSSASRAGRLFHDLWSCDGAVRRGTGALPPTRAGHAHEPGLRREDPGACLAPLLLRVGSSSLRTARDGQSLHSIAKEPERQTR